MANKANISSYKVVMCIACALLLILFFGCKSGSAGLKESTSHNRTDSTTSSYRNERTHIDSILKRDSIYIKDSVFIRQVGDTVYVDRWHGEYLYNFFTQRNIDLQNKDSGNFQYISVCDTIRIPYPVEKELSKWEKFQLKYAKWSMGALCMILVWLGYKLYRRIKNGGYNNTNRQARGL